MKNLSKRSVGYTLNSMLNKLPPEIKSESLISRTETRIANYEKRMKTETLSFFEIGYYKRDLKTLAVYKYRHEACLIEWMEVQKQREAEIKRVEKIYKGI